MVHLCKTNTNANYFFCNAKNAMVQALQSFKNLQKDLFLKLLYYLTDFLQNFNSSVYEHEIYQKNGDRLNYIYHMKV